LARTIPQKATKIRTATTISGQLGRGGRARSTANGSTSSPGLADEEPIDVEVEANSSGKGAMYSGPDEVG
jgi:hypothetical protein